MMYRISYWGGPRDGEKITLKYRPKDEVFCVDANTEVDPTEFYEQLEKNPLRTLKYHKYVLEHKEPTGKTKDEEFVYMFNGVV